MMGHLHNAGVERFRQQTLAHLHRHHAAICQHRTDAELLDYIDSMLAFCRSFGVVQQPNLLRMFDLQMHHAWAPPLTGYLTWRLRQPGFDEGLRVSHFAQALAMPFHPEVITLDTPLPDLETLHG